MYLDGIIMISIAFFAAVLLYFVLIRIREGRDIQVRGAALSEEVLETHAKAMAQEHSVEFKKYSAGWPMLRMNDNYNIILSVCKSLNEDIVQKRTVPPAAEWLLDNFYIVEEQVKSIRRDLSRKEYNDLPVLKRGPFKGYARIFAISAEFVSHIDGQIEVETLLKYLDAYQSHTVLLEREISIIPIMIKLALIEKIRTISEKVKETKEQWNAADEIFETWMAGEGDTESIVRLMKSNLDVMGVGAVNPSFVEHLFYRLRRSGRSYAGVLKYIDENLEKFHTSTEATAQKEHNVQAVHTVSMGNCIASLKYISSVNWSDIFESISFLEKILMQDPDGTYPQMDINSRNHYKVQIGSLARIHQVSELHIAQEAIELAKEAMHEIAAGQEERVVKSDRIPKEADQSKQRADMKRCHVGWYLVGKGLKTLEDRQKGEKTFAEKLKQKITGSMGVLYMSFIAGATLVTVCLAVFYAGKKLESASVYLVILTAVVVLIPASELAITVANWLICKVRKPAFFPRMELTSGIPEQFCTMVVIPALLSDEKRVEHLIENLESHYLANREKNLYFAILGMFSDAKGPSKENDTAILHAASYGVKALNAKYAKDGKDLFYFYNRLRKYNEKDNKWTGWERKRGTLMEFNEMLLGSQETSFIFYSSRKLPAEKIKYVITLDADTILPFGMAAKMIGAMAHPLNAPVIDPKRGIVIDGYGIMQPRISFDIESANRSIFSRIYTGQEGIDPYACAISDVYQDLFGEGIFTGKGIYELETFQNVLRDAFPDNAVLSHDLLEGSYVRAGLVTDLELVDSYPTKYNSYMARHHRWIRGDWQLIPWLRRNIRNRSGNRIRNPLSSISIWKITDNLRRSLFMPSVLLLILLGFSVLPGNGNLWAALALLAMGMPFILNFLDQLRNRVKYDKIKRYMPGFFGLKSSLFQFLLSMIFLPYQAVRIMDAVLVTLYRVWISKKNLLEWITSADVERFQSGTLQSYWRTMVTSPLIGILIAAAAMFWKPESAVFGIVFLVIWSAAPYIAYLISRDDDEEAEVLTKDERNELGKIARRTWRYFEEFSNSKNNYLAPDNFQEDPPRGVAYRSSPTNIGLGLLASLSGRDLGYTGIKEAVEMISKTISTIEKMEKWNGHLYNWYDTRTLEPLHPLYVSTVDSGNFVCYLIILQEGLKKYLSAPLVDAVFVRGIKDTLRNGLADNEPIPAEFHYFDFMDEAAPIDLTQWNRALDEMMKGRVVTGLKRPIWRAKTERMGRMFKEELNAFTPWVPLIEAIPEVLCCEELADESGRLLELLNTNVSLEGIALLNKKILRQIDSITKRTAKIKDQNFEEGYLWLNQMIEAILESNRFSQSFLQRYQSLIHRIETLSSEISFRPLYNDSRQLFSIGYNVDEKKLTNSYYDLLASEARQASYIAIARGEVPPKHWFMLGRLLTVVDHYKGLVSWSGTMFEYLMPLLVMKSYRNTLLDETYSFVVKSQQKYGKVRNMPWGVSESSFHSLDINLDYQYKAIGVPWLGLKRGLIEDAVTSPYSTFMALMVNPADAFKNIKYLKAEGLEGPYGFYEAADYTPERVNFQAKKVIIKSFMAHHEGMSLLALNNYLNENIMQTRFSSDPSVKAARLLLHEKVPVDILFTKDNKEKVVTSKAKIYRDKGAVRRFTAPDFDLPKVHVLSNGQYSVMLTDKGTGYSRNKTVDISRWREDPVLDQYGMFFYIKNVTENRYWSAAYAPCNVFPEKYEVVFTPDKATFERMDGDIETIMEVSAASEDQAEIRRISLKNNGDSTCEIQITSYFEIVLAPRNSDIAHPAFSNLFVRTEYDSAHSALLANRRPRTPEDKEIWMGQMAVINGDLAGEIQYETDRMHFIGRGHSPVNPAVIERDRPLSGTVGPVLDPVLSQRIKLTIEPDETASVSFVTITAATRESVLELMEKYDNMEACDAAFWLALTRSQVETKYLNIKAQEMELYQDMISNIVFSGPQKLQYRQFIRDNRKGQSSLWPYGISGDRPIVLVVLEKTEEVEILYEVLRAHEYWRIKDLRVDLVVLSHEENSYANPLHSLISEIVCSSQAADILSCYNDIYIINANNMPADDLCLFYAAARMVFKGGEGTLRAQARSGFDKLISVQPETERQPQGKALRKNVKEEHSIRKPTESDYLDSAEYDGRKGNEREPDQLDEGGGSAENQLQFYNGLGGFDAEGREYVIVLEQGQATPAPWVNVIANQEFGFMVTESGGGYCWSENSRENKLSPWSNDPVSDRPSEVFYLTERSASSDGNSDGSEAEKNERETWSLTPLPVREEEAYRIRHGFGYTEFQHTSHGIAQKLTQFVPLKGTVKINLISLFNESNAEKNLNVTYYVSPVLGVNQRENAMHLISGMSDGTLTVRNHYNREFPDRVFFLETSSKERWVTGDRKAFFGLGGMEAPDGLKTSQLDGTLGVGYDPCAAVQIKLSLKPGETREVVFLLGMTEQEERIGSLIASYGDTDKAKSALTEVKRFWAGMLQTVQVNTPDTAMNYMLNGWLLYQSLACRMWARTAFYQAGGAYGFRDQLQDSLSLLAIKPEVARSQIIRHAGRQFLQGDVLHWWHEPAGKGPRTRFSDDYLWLAFVTAEYIRVTGDDSILQEEAPFLDAEPLKNHEDERYCLPRVTEEKGTILDHCLRAIEYGLKFGERGIPLIGGGDWNDGMNTVGNGGKGESVWLGWFLCATLQRFIPICSRMGRAEQAQRYDEMIHKISGAIEENAWDGNWYKRAFFDNGAVLGSSKNKECKIDSLAQTWAVISGKGEPGRVKKAMGSLEDYLVMREEGLIKLLTPPFDNGDLEPGYIKGYVPGVRENGGQYTHAAAWVIIAFAMLGDGDKALELFDLINPINHSRTGREASIYKVEPYVIAADVYSVYPHVGRGGWTWYTGSAGWVYKAGVESILGLSKDGETLTINPCIPRKWQGFTLTYRYGTSEYRITVKNPKNLSSGIELTSVDGKEIKGNTIELSDDGRTHEVEIMMG
ncbi:GH36-type glycosyl hydrolase domain-containing protein [Anoxybacterium hadale]|uniref:GH36-type glycosyl hydrolase domain-containing protein n=1 Tax=Anoxybacterium hadale TaxID=3408580 RepID=UPI003B001083